MTAEKLLINNETPFTCHNSLSPSKD